MKNIVPLVVLSLILVAGGPVSGQVTLPSGVESVYPVPGATDVSLSTGLSVDLESGYPTMAFLVRGSISGLHTGSIMGNPMLNSHIFNPDRDFYSGETVSVTIPEYDFTWTFTATVGASSGSLSSAVYISAGNNVFGLDLCDVNKDMNVDIATTLIAAVGTDGSVVIMRGDGDLNFDKDFFSADGHPYGVATGDYSGDGSTDLATSSYFSRLLALHWNDGSGSFSAGPTYLVGYDPVDIINGDWDNDGDLDIACCNRADDELRIIINNGDGTFWHAGLPTGDQPQGVVARDFNEDGNLDLAVACYGADIVYVHFGNGDGIFPTNIGYATGAEPMRIDAADFDHDGHLDVAVVLYGPSAVNVLFGDGDGGLGDPIGFSSDHSPTDLIATDLTGDGYADLAVVCAGSNLVRTYMNQQDRTFTPGHFRTVSNSPQRIEAGDMNGDGTVDLVLSYASFDHRYVAIVRNWPALPSCCVDRVGDANGLGGDEPTIGDVSVMIDAKFITGTCDGILECFAEADINQTGSTAPTCDDITIGDISTLIDYLFITGSSLGLPDCL